jgi:hypothetical protein
MCSGGVSLFSGKKECMHARVACVFFRQGLAHFAAHACKPKDSKEVGLFFFASPAFAELDPMWRRRRRRGVKNLACDNLAASFCSDEMLSRRREW